MSVGRVAQDGEPGLLGIEIGRNKVRLTLLDADGKVVDDAVERPIAKGGGPRDPMEEESSTRAAIEAGVERLGLTTATPILVGVTIGFPHCGVGSGPALRDWLGDLSLELGEPIVFVGDHGVSYAPAHCIDFVRRVFEPTNLMLDRIELAPVAASRVLESLRSGAITLGSGVAWSARILDRDVLEAFEIVDGTFDEVLHVVSNGVGEPIEHLEGVLVAEELCRNRGLTMGALAPAVGVAVALQDSASSNLLEGEVVSTTVRREPGPFPQVETRSSGPLPVREGRPLSGERREEWSVTPSLEGRRSSGELGYERPVSGERREPVPQWGSDEDLLPEPPAVDPRSEERPRGSREGYETGEFGYTRDYLDDTTYKLRRLPSEVRPRSGPPDQEWTPGPAAGRAAKDELAGIESFSPQPTSLEAREGFHVSDFILGALLMLAVVLLIAFVVL
jgi:hypothetical protein